MALFREDEPEREAYVAQVIRDIDPDVLMLTDMGAFDYAHAIDSVQRLAERTGLTCTFPQHTAAGAEAGYAVLKGTRTHGQAILWKQRDDIRVIPESLRLCLTGFWHGAIFVAFEMDGVLIYHGCFHGAPRAGRTLPVELAQMLRRREAEASFLANIVQQLGGQPLLMGADRNWLSADQLDNGEYYDIVNIPDEFGPAVQEAECSRRPGEILLHAGLYDVATAFYRPDIGRKFTTGHAQSDPYNGGIIDGFSATTSFFPALRTFDVPNTELTRAASDHLPPVVTYDTASLRT
jgi:hypothetical protein